MLYAALEKNSFDLQIIFRDLNLTRREGGGGPPHLFICTDTYPANLRFTGACCCGEVCITQASKEPISVSHIWDGIIFSMLFRFYPHDQVSTV